MKILAKDKIVESFRFPISEALVFSILVWSAWGLAEAFYWAFLSGLLDPAALRMDRFIYIEAFLSYVAVAVVIAALVYGATKISMTVFHVYDSYIFRGATLSTILGLFFLITLHYSYYNYLLQSALPPKAQVAIIAALFFLALLLTWLLYRWASGVGFRIRRSGTMMLSVAVLSILLSFVRFPIFSSELDEEASRQTQTGFHKLMAYYYVKPLLGEQHKEVIP